MLDMASHSYTMDTDLKEGLLHPTLTTVLWIVCMEIIQKKNTFCITPIIFWVYLGVIGHSKC